MRRVKSVTMSVDPKFYEKIEQERKQFMKKQGMYKLTTKAFTGILVNKKWIQNEKHKQKKR